MNKRGETLLEVLIALTLVAVSSAAASSAIISANKGLSLSKNYLIAQNLASEGLEIVKNIRDTNWMKFPVNKEECWLNLKEGITLSNQCESDNASSIAYATGENAKNDYYFTKLADKWILTHDNASTVDDLAEKYGLKIDPTSHSYIPIETGEEAIFYRGMRVLEKDDNNEKILIEVIVKWYEGAKLFEIAGQEVLTNYL